MSAVKIMYIDEFGWRFFDITLCNLAFLFNFIGVVALLLKLAADVEFQLRPDNILLGRLDQSLLLVMISKRVIWQTTFIS